ncbi:MAG: hypothetical protein A3H70_02305 [Candidatus Komeilibacteria bacterium RIFCSPLOWO2_02_FULL_48_11]|uniref:Uncharacterized protein n=1 Tax=Candidatus Komeilibacteria bacterium RIFCSPLOWO2_02_FULL_48_11 TaxID=1798553 RepID=A0A1G2BSW4_9BACT|nr:MAG: hypothetical protein A3H70_02305 [Candidatus Komeilibacteria bacterium RIFCSPLOWO2_02_FULL_48_11]
MFWFWTTPIVCGIVCGSLFGKGEARYQRMPELDCIMASVVLFTIFYTGLVGTILAYMYDMMARNEEGIVMMFANVVLANIMMLATDLLWVKFLLWWRKRAINKIGLSVKW